MPTAIDLGLPERGSVGFSINLGEPYISAELTYESHPLEALFGGGGLAAVAGAGVVAAIAIPAYQDYTIRVQVTEGLNLAAVPKAAVAEAFLARGAAPADREAAGLPADPALSSGRYVAGIDVVDGTVVVRYGNAAHPMLSGRTLALRPYRAADDSFSWACGRAAPPPGLEAIGGSGAVATTVESKHLPTACRP
jgi:type IV pilus assembly protein PilA